jgi:ubiquinone/menaquinone biosynthesis C-methylase UbiE
MKQKKEFFDQLADTWEDQSFPPETRKRVANLVGTFGVQRGARVLDVATGTGILLPYLLQAVGKSGHVYAFDYSFKMLLQAKKKPFGANLDCFQASAMAIPLPAGLCDTVVCFAAFPHFADQLKALQEMARVAKKSAPIYVAHLMSRDELLKHHGNHSPVAGDTVPEAADMRRMCRSAGLTDPHVIDKSGLYLARALKRS